MFAFSVDVFILRVPPVWGKAGNLDSQESGIDLRCIAERKTNGCGFCEVIVGWPRRSVQTSSYIVDGTRSAMRAARPYGQPVIAVGLTRSSPPDVWFEGG